MSARVDVSSKRSARDHEAKHVVVGRMADYGTPSGAAAVSSSGKIMARASSLQLCAWGKRSVLIHLTPCSIFVLHNKLTISRTQEVGHLETRTFCGEMCFEKYMNLFIHQGTLALSILCAVCTFFFFLFLGVRHAISGRRILRSMSPLSYSVCA